MKKSLFFILGICSLVLITGCGNSDKNLSVYEWHYYDKDFKHTEEFIAKYNEEGELSYLETIFTYDQNVDYPLTIEACELQQKRRNESLDAEYKGVEAKCEVTDSTYTWRFIMTSDSIKEGYLTDEKDYEFSYLENYYPKLKNEELAKENIQKLIDMYKEETVCDDMNYAVIKGEKTCW